MTKITVDLNDPKSRWAGLKAIRGIEALEKQKLRRNRSLSLNPVDWLEGLIRRGVEAVLKGPKPK